MAPRACTRDGRRVGHPLARLDLDAHLGRPVGAAVLDSWALALAIHAQLGGAPTRLYEAYCAALHCPDVGALVRWSHEHVTSDERAELFRT